MLLIGVGLGYIGLLANDAIRKGFLSGWVENHTPQGKRSRMVLADGSIVHLNAGSTIRYPASFDRKREVYLSGEAFFEVVKNPSRPFLIHLDNGTVKVLGTSFNVKPLPGKN